MPKLIKVLYSKSSLKDLKQIDYSIAKRIVKKITYYTTNSPLKYATPLKGEMKGKYRYRVGDYRVVFTYNDAGEIMILTVLWIKHRKDVYKNK